ncbi:MAG TPA: ArsC family reductase [Phenylobacterium sp.]|nr:ArsC family reductase [Phenylobacterium sp.]
MAVHLYGIRNCDTMKKARTWLDAQGVDYIFHDYKVEGADAAWLRSLVDKVGWEAVLNRAGTTFRKLPEAERSGLDAEKAIALMVAQPSMIKRPVLVAGEEIRLGFKPDVYEAIFKG